ncbi:MAG TPA: type II secretion system major pseudopilin GspG [Pirellulaceae bacterium]|nr:type II secretion system major pseudopilin GspG [Pirellulaceae bacterium]
MSSSSTRHRRGFTLVEMMAVLAIIGLLSAVLIVSVRGYVVRGRLTTARLAVGQLAKAIELFETDEGRLPSEEEGLDVLKRPAVATNEPYYTGSLKDPWGRPYHYLVPGPDGRPFEVLSLGADGREGGSGPDADISHLDDPDA